jgi:hypothetical protein
MVATGLRTDRVLKLADEIRAKVVAEAPLLARADGKITIEAIPKGKGYDLRVTVRTR